MHHNNMVTGCVGYEGKKKRLNLVSVILNETQIQ
jgi:hypothetical protein